MSKSVQYILASLCVLSVVLFPEIKLTANIPALQLIDFLLPFLGVFILKNRTNIAIKRLYIFLMLFCGYIIFTIIINRQSHALNNYFEIYKIIKLLMVCIFFSLIDIDFKKIIKPIFIGVVLFNMLHYFNIYGFNSIIKTYYGGGIHIDFFGLNSLKQPDVKRMIGTMYNPNNNALLFLAFSILFLPIKDESKSSYIYFSLAIAMVFLCHSRTSYIALFMVMIVYIVLNKINTRETLKLTASIGASYLFFLLISLNSPSRIIFEGTLNDYSSMRGRYESWLYLWDMIKSKPIFGYSPFKSYFYGNNLYSENEYILFTWRYGLVGLIMYVAFLGHIFLAGMKNKTSNFGLKISLFTIAIAITAITNNPLTERSIIVLFAIILGLSFNQKKEYETV